MARAPATQQDWGVASPQIENHKTGKSTIVNITQI